MMDLSFSALEKKLLAYPGSYLDYPFGDDVSVYKIRLSEKDSKMFAILTQKGDFLRLSLKCDPTLAQTLREKYESVMPGYHLPKKHWNTIVLSGQLEWPDVAALIDHSYDLVKN